MKNIGLLLVERVLLLDVNIKPEQIKGVYPYGSVTYNTQTENSDYDFVAIVDMEDEYIQYESDEIDIHIISISYYAKLLDNHNIMAMEVYFNPSPLKRFDECTFELDLPKLRKEISSVSSNSWVKAKKKVMLKNENDWIGYKSLFHSMRILNFGTQIAKYGIIKAYDEMSVVWTDIIAMIQNNVTFESILTYYKPIHNANSTEFRKLAPKK